MGITKKAVISIGCLSLFLSILGAETLEHDCLQCHQAQQIPSGLIYKRYLMKYSTPESIENAMYAYLKEPLQSRSIMPPQFFLKFPMKPPLNMDEKQIRQDIRAYINKFDVKKRLRLAE